MARLRTRLTLYFLAAAAPAALVSGAAVLVLDHLIADEIARRTEDVAAATRLLVEGERARVAAQVDALAGSEELIRTILEPAEAGDEPEDRRLRDRNAALAAIAAARQLEILAVVEAEGGAATVVASAHLPSAAGDEAPSFVAPRTGTTARAGFVEELVAGNPPRPAPALIAVRPLAGSGEPPRAVLYGGARLDTHRLDAIARSARARVSLALPGGRTLAFPAEPAGASAGVAEGADWPGAQSIPLPGLEAGAASIRVVADTARLAGARKLFALAAGGLGALGLLLAVLAGAGLARRITGPILALSRAASAVGAGDLEVRLAVTSADEVGGLITVFNQMTGELAESRERLQRAERIAAWREIARRVAHEIKNPLSPIQMSVETLRKSYRARHPALDEIVEETTRTVLEEVRALNRIVTEFSDFARLPAPRREPVELLAIFDHLAALYARPGGPHQLALDRAAIAARRLPAIAADREQLERALINLVKNALEAMPDGGTLSLDAHPETRAGRAGVRLDVRDSGQGIPPDVRARLFTPYFTTKSGGSGLGLAIVARIAEEHQGEVSVESEQGEGSMFSLWLPS